MLRLHCAQGGSLPVCVQQGGRHDQRERGCVRRRSPCPCWSHGGSLWRSRAAPRPRRVPSSVGRTIPPVSQPSPAVCAGAAFPPGLRRALGRLLQRAAARTAVRSSPAGAPRARGPTGRPGAHARRNAGSRRPARSRSMAAPAHARNAGRSVAASGPATRAYPWRHPRSKRGRTAATAGGTERVCARMSSRRMVMVRARSARGSPGRALAQSITPVMRTPSVRTFSGW